MTFETNELENKMTSRFPFYHWIDECGNKQVTNFLIGEGWLASLWRLSLAIEEQLVITSALESTNFVIYEVKEKYGGMRFDTSAIPDKRIGELLRQAEDESFHVCEECSGPGQIRNNRLWIETLCDRCNEKR